MEKEKKKIKLILPICLFMIGVIFVGISFSGILENKNTTVNDKNVLKNATFAGSFCMDSKCTISLTDSKNITREYNYNSSNEDDLLYKINDYKDYIILDVYFNKKGNKSTIVDYKIYLKSTNEELVNIKSEDKLREKLGLYLSGEHTDLFTLKEIGTEGYGFNDNGTYSYKNFTFIDGKNNEYEMEYKNDYYKVDFIEGNKYNVTFEVIKGTLGYEYEIKSIN